MIRLSAFSDEAGDSLSQQLQALHRNGLSMMELRSVDRKNISTFTEAEARAMRAELDREGITLSALGSPLGKVDLDERFAPVEDQLRHLCELALIYGTDRIRMFSFKKAYGDRSRVLEYLSRMVEIANEYGVKLCHENEKGIYGDTAERVADLMESVQGLRFVYDPANFLQTGETADQTLDRFCDRCDYFHVKDVVLKTGQLVPAGHGDGQISTLLERLKDRDTILTVEPHLKVFGSYQDIDGEKMEHKFFFETNDQAFDAAVNALKELLGRAGYREVDGGYQAN
ncbi:MAG: sugar phosphate isomerase/epimerase [Ruminococcaceae bacterium]|nr:sugar phosphate isomerase/epimerase [Oscillospiraceae bacterium]